MATTLTKKKGSQTKNSSRSTQPIHKIYNRVNSWNYKQIRRSPKITKRSPLESLIKFLLSSKCLLFFSFQIIQKRQKGTTWQTFLLFLPKKTHANLITNPSPRRAKPKTTQTGRKEGVIQPNSCHNEWNMINQLFHLMTKITTICR